MLTQFQFYDNMGTHRQASPRFIEDLVHLILASDDHWWPRDLLRLARVSPAWLAPARKRLYAHPSLRSFRACGLLARTLTENPCLRTLLHGIDIRPSIGYGVDEGGLTAAEMASLRFIFSLDGLRTLTLGGEVAVQAERFLHLLGHPEAVTELHIDGSLQNAGQSYLRCQKPASMEWDEVMAFKFPNLRILRFSNLELDIVYPPMPYDIEVTDLHLDHVDIVSGHLSQLFNESWSSLKHLSVIAQTAMDSEEHLRLTLDCCGDSLEALSYEVVDARSDRLLFDDDTAPLPSLRRLRLDGVDVHERTLDTIQRTCHNLDELSITGRAVRVSPSAWVSFLSSGSLPSLRHLGAPWGTCHPPFTHWSKEASQLVLDASADRHIELPCPLTAASRC